MKVKSSTLVCFLFGIALYVSIFIKTDNFLLSTLFSLFFCVFSSYLLSIKDNYFFVSFLITFFVFLLGRIMMTQLFGMEEKNYTPLVEAGSYNVMYCIMIISIIALVIGYNSPHITLNLPSIALINRMSNVSDDYNYALQAVTRTTFCFLQIIAIIVSAERIVYNYTVGYFSSYLSYTSRLPSFLQTLSSVEPVALSLYLATMPSKKHIKIPLLFYSASIITNAIGGARYKLVSGLLLILVYAAMRNQTDEEEWISKKLVIMGCILLPLFVVVLQFMSSWRLGGKGNFDNPIGEFLYAIGGSGYISGYADMLKEQLRERDVIFSLGRVWKFIFANPVSKVLFNTVTYNNQTVDNALYGCVMGDAITYYMRGKDFVNGYGMGSSYIAELYIDFSYFGVFFGNILIGNLLKKARRLIKNDVIHNFFTIFLVILIFRIPRDSFDFFIIEFIGISNILCFAVLMILAGNYNKKLKNY